MGPAELHDCLTQLLSQFSAAKSHSAPPPRLAPPTSAALCAHRLVAWHELGGVVPRVLANRVSHVLSPVLDGALAGDDGLHEEAEHGEHRKAAVLDLLHLQLGEGVGVVSQAEGIEALTRVQGVEVLTQWAAVDAERLSAAHQHNLHAHVCQMATGLSAAS